MFYVHDYNFNLLTRVLFGTFVYMAEVLLLSKVNNIVQAAASLVLTRDQFILRKEVDKITGAAQLHMDSPCMKAASRWL